MHPKVQAYIDTINGNMLPPEIIRLSKLALRDADVEPLMAALESNPAVAQRIQRIYLDENQLTAIAIPATLTALKFLDLTDNQLTAIAIPATLTALRVLDLRGNQLTAIAIPATLTALLYLYLDRNQLTTATKIALRAVHAIIGGNLAVMYDGPLAANTVLTHEILDEHFKTILRFDPLKMLSNLKKNSAVNILSRIPIELIKSGMLPKPTIEYANTSMAYLKHIFKALAELNNDYAQLNIHILVTYIDTRFKNLLTDAEDGYSVVFNLLKDHLVNAERANATASSQPNVNSSLQDIAHEYKLLKDHYYESVKKLSRDFNLLKHSRANTNYENQNCGLEYKGEKDEILEIYEGITGLQKVYNELEELMSPISETLGNSKELVYDKTDFVVRIAPIINGIADKLKKLEDRTNKLRQELPILKKIQLALLKIIERFGNFCQKIVDLSMGIDSDKKAARAKHSMLTHFEKLKESAHKHKNVNEEKQSTLNNHFRTF